MGKKEEKIIETIDPNRIKIRDELIKKLIQGATKANIEKDRKKEKNKYHCRHKENKNE